MLCFTTTLVVAATCLLLSAGVPETTVTTCEGDNLHRLSCDTGVISVQAAMYGRADNVTCSEGRSPQEISDTDCSLIHSVDVLKLLCNGKKVCEISLEVFKVLNPCKETFKYLQTKYTCLTAIHLVTCEESLAHLQCNEGQVISVFAADFGRHNQITCSYKRPASQIQNTDCYRQRNHVFDRLLRLYFKMQAEDIDRKWVERGVNDRQQRATWWSQSQGSCDEDTAFVHVLPTLPTELQGALILCSGKNSCIVKASSSVFGDPCEGTYKYLEVAYFCEDPVTNLS